MLLFLCDKPVTFALSKQKTSENSTHPPITLVNCTTKNSLLTAAWCLIGSIVVLTAIYLLADYMDSLDDFREIQRTFKEMVRWSFSKTTSLTALTGIIVGLVYFGPSLYRWVSGTPNPAAPPRANSRFSTVLNVLLGILVVSSMLIALSTLGAIAEYFWPDSVKWIMPVINEWHSAVQVNLLIIVAFAVFLFAVVSIWKAVKPSIAPWFTAVTAHAGPVIWAWATSRDGVVAILAIVAILFLLGAGFFLWLIW